MSTIFIYDRGNNLVMINADRINSAWVQAIGNWYCIGLDVAGKTYHAEVSEVGKPMSLDKAERVLIKMWAEVDAHRASVKLDDIIEDIA